MLYHLLPVKTLAEFTQRLVQLISDQVFHISDCFLTKAILTLGPS